MKSQIGHTKCAAGPGRADQDRAGPAHRRPAAAPCTCEQPNPAWDAGAQPVRLPHRGPAVGGGARRPGRRGQRVRLRRHQLPRGAARATTRRPPPAHGLDEWPAELFLFRGADRRGAARGRAGCWQPAANDRRRSAVAAARPRPRPPPRRVRPPRGDRSQVGGRGRATWTSWPTLLRRATRRRARPGRTGSAPAARTPDAERGPGQGGVPVPRPGQPAARHARRLFVAFPELQRLPAARRAAGPTLLFPPAAFDEPGRRRSRPRITDTRVAQPALGIAGLAADAPARRARRAARTWSAGHSYGELVALVRRRRVRRRRPARAERRAGRGDPRPPAGDGPGHDGRGRRAAPTTSPRLLRPAGLADRGRRRQPQLAAADRDLRARPTRSSGRRARCATPGSAPSASRWRARSTARWSPGPGDGLRRGAGRPRRCGAPECPVWSNRTAAPYGADPDARPRRTRRADRRAGRGSSSRSRRCTRPAPGSSSRPGPAPVLTRLVGAILGDRPHRTVALRGRPAGRRAAPASSTRSPSWPSPACRCVPAGCSAAATPSTPLHAVPPKRPAGRSTGSSSAPRDGDHPPGALHPPDALAPGGDGEPRPDRTARPTAHAGPGALIAEFLRTSREMVAAQRDVLLAYFGTAGSAARSRLSAPLPVPAIAPAPVRHPGHALPLPARSPRPPSATLRTRRRTGHRDRTGRRA